jgi:DNA invertase Pin-like site-specific DNA recombinase
MNKNIQLKFFIYCRRSSEESSHRQIASIGDQIQALEKVVYAEGLNITERPFTEERSSKDPGRPVFNELLDRIESGEANAILCWDIDRLYRNPVDEGRLRWMLQKGVIRVIKTPYRSFYPEDAGLLMGVEGGRATDYVIRLSKNVKRGLNGRVQKGWRPTSAPIGYKNTGDEGNKTIVPDEERFDIVKRMWELYLTGAYSPAQVLEIATRDFGLRTVIKRTLGGKPMTLSNFYKILNEPFYYGKFWWTNPETGEKVLYEGKHTPMITEEEFDRAQILLGRKGKPQPKNREFAYTGIMRCGECDSSITAEEKHQVICTHCKYKFSYLNKTSCPKCHLDISKMINPKILHYTYYHCTKKKNKNCSQKSLTIQELEKQLNLAIAKITIDNDYLTLALEYLQDKQKAENNSEASTRINIQSNLDDCIARLKNLNKEYTSPLNTGYEIYTPDEYKTLKGELLIEKKALEDALVKSDNRFMNSIEASEKTFNFCRFAMYHFTHGSLKKKREIISSIGSNITLKDQKVIIDAIHPYLLVEKELKAQKELLATLERKNSVVSEGYFANYVASVPAWLGYKDSNLFGCQELSSSWVDMDKV